MKTPEQWANRVQNSKEPWAKLVAEIQNDALKHSAGICRNMADDMPGCYLETEVLRKCANKIEAQVNK